MILKHVIPCLCLFLTGCITAPASPVPGTGEGSSSLVSESDTPAGYPLRLTDQQQRAHDVDALLRQGKTVVLVFWQPWCAPCRREAPHLAERSRELTESHRFFGIVSGPDEVVNAERVAECIERYNISYPTIRDGDASLSRRFGVKGTPTLIILKGTQEVFRGHRAPQNWSF